MTSVSTRFSRLAGLASAAVVALAAGTASAAPPPGTNWGLPPDMSLEGWRIDWLLNVTMFFVALLFVIMVIWMAWAVIKHNRDHEAEYDHGTGKKQVAVALTISAGIFFVVDGNLFVNALIDLHGAFWDYERAESHPEAVRIEINAHQWAWDARYAGPDGRFNTPDDIVTLNDIRVPVKTPVIIQEASPDVMHSIFIPNLRFKLDAIPGTIMYAWFQAEQVGEYELACVQHCGPNHYQMGGMVTVLSKDDYAAWATEASAQSKLAYDPADLEAHWGWPWKEL